MTAPVPRRPWTDAERLLARALARCRFAPATWSKRFARDMAEQERRGQGITDREEAALRRLVAIFRRQVRPESIAPESRYLLDEETARRLRTRAISPVPPRPPPEPKPPRIFEPLRVAHRAPPDPNQLGLFRGEGG